MSAFWFPPKLWVKRIVLLTTKRIVLQNRKATFILNFAIVKSVEQIVQYYYQYYLKHNPTVEVVGSQFGLQTRTSWVTNAPQSVFVLIYLQKGQGMDVCWTPWSMSWVWHWQDKAGLAGPAQGLGVDDGRWNREAERAEQGREKVKDGQAHRRTGMGKGVASESSLGSPIWTLGSCDIHVTGSSE